MGQFFGWLRDLFLDGLDAVREFGKGLLEDFRESNRFFKIKLFLVGGYVVVGVLTLLIFIPGGELNEIDAYVDIRKTEIVGGKYFLVKNQSSESWRKLVLTLNDSYVRRWPKLRPGKKKAFFFNRFKDARGQIPSDEVRVTTLRIECDQGEFERDFRKK